MVPLNQGQWVNICMRPICPSCTNNRPVAVNCYRNGRVYYRRQCDSCLRAGRTAKLSPPAWYKRGYRKKPACEVCGFIARLPDLQLLVFHVDGDLRNTDTTNLKTVCLNCHPVLRQRRVSWKPAGVQPDF
jgi:hypothetical protein